MTAPRTQAEVPRPQAALAADRAGFGAEPPLEVLAEIAAAAAVHERLRRRGKQVRFRLGARPGAVQVELLDRLGGGARTLALGEAFALACPLRAR
jgi:hypothetical protein